MIQEEMHISEEEQREAGEYSQIPPMTADLLPEDWGPRLIADGAEGLRLSVARAQLPMPPGLLVLVLAYLSHDNDEAVQTAAKKSTLELPEAFLQGVLRERGTHPTFLDHYARVFNEDDRYTELLVLNANTADETIRYLAGCLTNAQHLEVIARNQVRFLRYPAIVEALYYNPETLMGSISRVIETAARHGISLHHIPGFKEVEASILGEEAIKMRSEKGELTEEELDQFLSERKEDEIEDDAFQQILKDASDEVEEFAAEGEGDDDQQTPLWKSVGSMSPAQKVRLALTGNATIRKLLVRDAKRIVTASVLKNPRLTGKEVIQFAQQKSLSEDVIRTISKNKEWTRHYKVKMALLKNPKTPTTVSLWFIKSVMPKDLKSLAKDKDVPGFIQKTAKRMIQIKERKALGKGR